MPYASIGQGVHGSGQRTYAASQGRALLAAISGYRGSAQAVTVEELARQTGVAGRAVRQFLSDYDGAMFLLGEDGDGYFVCDCADDGERLTGRLARQVKTMQERIARRRQYAANELPRRQDELWQEAS